MKEVKKISLKELKVMSKNMFEDIVKVDVDIAKKIVVVDMGMHADGEAYLLGSGSHQTDLWGINLHPDKYGQEDFIEFDSMINIRPNHGNASKDVLDPKVRQEIIKIIGEVVNG